MPPHKPKSRGGIKPPRFVRLAAAIGFFLGGLAFVIFPSKVITAWFDASFVTYVVGGLFIVGGFLKGLALSTRRLNIDRAGLSALAAGMGVVACTNTIVFFLVRPITWASVAGIIILWSLTLFIFARWQDVKHEIRLADEALGAVRELEEKESGRERLH